MVLLPCPCRGCPSSGAATCCSSARGNRRRSLSRLNTLSASQYPIRPCYGADELSYLLGHQAQQIAALQGMGKEIAPRDGESKVAKRDFAGFDRALTFAEAALQKGPKVQLGTGEGGSGVGIIVDNNPTAGKQGIVLFKALVQDSLSLTWLLFSSQLLVPEPELPRSGMSLRRALQGAVPRLQPCTSVAVFLLVSIESSPAHMRYHPMEAFSHTTSSFSLNLMSLHDPYWLPADSNPNSASESI